MTIYIDGQSLTIDAVVQVARHHAAVGIAPETAERVRRSRRFVEDILTEGRTVYGVNTGYGKLSHVSIPLEDVDQLQKNLIVSCCTGVGEPFAPEIVRAMLLLRANSLLRGNSGVRPLLMETMVEMLNKDVTPVVPQQGSVGASGDLAPLSHMALVLLGEGQAYYQGEILPGAAAMAKAGIRPVTLKAKEGLSLCNGTQAMTAVGALAVYDAERLAQAADIAAALTGEALEVIMDAYDEKIQRLRPHTGQIETAKNMRRLLEGSEIVAKAAHGRVQDAYTLRCVPQVHGASKDAIAYVRRVVETEINAVTDNPLIFADAKQVLSGGNFHGQPVALAMDFLAIAVAELANISERRTERLVNPALSGGLPAFLIEQGGINDGMMMPQYTAASLVSENKTLAHPASVDSIPTSANQEDHVSMGTTGARQAGAVLKNAQYVVAIELMCACQGLEFRPHAPAPRMKLVYELVREKTPRLEQDRVLSPEIEAVARLIREGALLSALR